MSQTGWTPVDESAAPTGWTPVEESTPPPDSGTGFWSHVGQSVKSMLPSASATPQSLGDVMEGAAKAGIPAISAAQSMYNAAKEAFAARQRGHGIPYSAAAGASTLVGVNPERMEDAASKGDTAGVLGEAAVPTALAVSPLAAEGVGRAVGAATDTLPSARRAGQALQDVKATAGNVPIDMAAPGDAALELYEQSQRGVTLPKAVRQFVLRATQPGSDPITYQEAKDFQSNVSALSANEKLSMKPNTVRLLGNLNSALKDSLSNAADVSGKGEQFQKAMSEYHNAMTVRNWTDEAKSLAIKGALGAAGLYGVRKLLGLD